MYTTLWTSGGDGMCNTAARSSWSQTQMQTPDLLSAGRRQEVNICFARVVYDSNKTRCSWQDDLWGDYQRLWERMSRKNEREPFLFLFFAWQMQTSNQDEGRLSLTTCTEEKGGRKCKDHVKKNRESTFAKERLLIHRPYRCNETNQHVLWEPHEKSSWRRVDPCVSTLCRILNEVDSCKTFHTSIAVNYTWSE